MYIIYMYNIYSTYEHFSIYMIYIVKNNKYILKRVHIPYIVK